MIMALISQEYLRNTTWCLSRADGFILAPALRFRDFGIIGGIVSKWERVWELRDNRVLLQDISGVTTTSFEVKEEDEQGIRELRGNSRVVGSIEHVLTRVEMPSLDETPVGNPDDLSSIGIIKSGQKGRRSNLVVLRAGNSSLHREWPRYLADDDRNWDLCISWYGADLPSSVKECEYFFHQRRDMKFTAIANLFFNQPALLEYENFWFPDDDLETSWKDINRLFNIFRRSRLDLAQPSLSSNSNSYVNHQVTAQNPEYFLRYCDFVELMCPMLSQELLQICLPAFRGTKQAFCLDHVWGGLQGRVPGRIAIIDDVVVTHTRPMGVSYSGEQAMDEGNRLAALYGIEGSFAVHGGINREGGLL
ncbi:hypothetical protein [Sphingobium indicum]